MDSDGKGSCAHLGSAERGSDVGSFSLTVSPGSCSQRKQEVLEPRSPKEPLSCWQGPQGPVILAGRQAGSCFLDTLPSQDPSFATRPARPQPPMHPGLLYLPRSQHWGEPGQLPHTAAKALTHQLRQFSAGTAMGSFRNPS